MKLFSKNQLRTHGAVRRFVVVPAVLALTVTLAACDDDQDPAASGTDTSSAAAGESGDVAGGRENGGGESGSADTAASSAARVEDVEIEDFEVGDGYYSFLLEDEQTVCSISGGATPLSGLGCFVELEDAPFDPANSVPVSLFEMTPEGAAGLTTDLHTIDRTGIETLEPGQRIEVDGISCTALGARTSRAKPMRGKSCSKTEKLRTSPWYPVARVPSRSPWNRVPMARVLRRRRLRVQHAVR